MKISNIIIAFTFLFAVACTSNKDDHGHEHGTEAGEHSHDSEGNHEEQEEFTTEEGVSTSATSTDESSIITTNREDSVTVIVPANKGVEYKFNLKQYEKLTYKWTTTTPLYFDFHGEPLDYAKTKYFESFTEGTADKMKGTMTAPFEGSHGWYWKNTTGKDVSVTLVTKGNYNVIGMKK
ncbi:MAG: hypothetical protein R2804_06165 [Cyclobacteriaceae bacterium]